MTQLHWQGGALAQGRLSTPMDPWHEPSPLRMTAREEKQVPRSAYPIASVGVMGPQSAALGMTG